MNTTNRLQYVMGLVAIAICVGQAGAALADEGAAAASPAAPTPALYMPMEENQLLAVPAAGVTVTPKGTPVFAEGKKGKALVVDNEGVSVSSVLLHGAKLMDPQQGTIVFWMRPALDFEKDGKNNILTLKSTSDKNNARYLYIQKQSLVHQALKDGKWLDSHFLWSWIGRPTWSPKLWYHIAVTWAPDQRERIYVNGQKMDERSPMDLDKDLNVDVIIIGGNPPGSADMLLDELAIYNQMLTPAQVKALAEGSDIASPAKVTPPPAASKPAP